MRNLWPIVLLPACIPGLPPPGHYAALNPAPVYTGPTAEVTVTPLSLPPLTLAAAYTTPLPEQPWFLIEAYGSASYTGLTDPDTNGGYVAFSPGLWIVTHPGEEGGHFGARLGGSLGSGDLLGVYEFNMPYAGPTLHLQYANLGPEGGSFATTFGAEFLLPMFPDKQTTSGTDSNGTPISIFPFPSLWVGVDARGDIPVGERAFLIVGGGFDVSLPLYLFITPNLTLGARF